ncbi:MAG: NAD(P)/FAD-dependent oxidoreductase [Bacteroidetes bacterium]|nr:NAD(P)/FAD-dependent oxidoreductase [Bacteroidota bacterium]
MRPFALSTPHAHLCSAFVEQKKVIIIGAGPAGLTAAYELLSRSSGFEVTILEASADIGGISKTVNYKGNRIDIGGHRFFSKSDRVMNWWLQMMPVDEQAGKDIEIRYHGKSRELHVPISAPPAGKDNVMLVRNRLSRIYFLRRFFTYPVSMGWDTMRNLGAVRIVKILFSYAWVNVFPRKPEKTLEDFFINRFGKELYLTFFKDYTEKVWGFKCSEISRDWGVQRIKGLSVWKTVMHAIGKLLFGKSKTDIGQKGTETSLIEKFLYPKFGPGQMWEGVAEKVKKMGAVLHLQQEVCGIDGTVNRLNAVSARCADGTTVTYDADLVFSTMPVKDLFESFRFGVDEMAKDVAVKLPYRDFITVGLLCDELEIKNNGKNQSEKQKIVPDNWIYIQERDVKIGRLQIFNNWSPYMVANPHHTWIGLEYFCNEGDELWSLDDASFIQMAIQELHKIGILNPEKVLDSTLLRMKKTYPAYTGSYREFDKVKRVLDGIVNLYPIGRNGMHKYNNSDHSMLTAMTAVDNILSGNLDKSNLWQINTEEDYHEEK